MLFNSISNQYNRIGGDPEHLRRMKLIESQRATYLPAQRHRPVIESRIFIEKDSNSSVNNYLQPHKGIGRMQKQLLEPTSMQRDRDSQRRSFIFDNRSMSSQQRSDLRNSRLSGRSVGRDHNHDNDETKYTFNPITEKKAHMTVKPLSGGLKAIPSKCEYKVISPHRWRSGNQNVRFSYGYQGVGGGHHRSQIQQAPRRDLYSHDQNQNRNRNQHYFPVSSSESLSEFNEFSRRPVIESTINTNRSTRHMSNSSSQLKIFSRTYPETDKQSEEEADRFFDMDFKAGNLVETPLSDNLTKYEQNNLVQSPFDLPLTKSKNQSSALSKSYPTVAGLKGTLSERFNKLDKDGKLITLVLVGLGIFLVILQTIQ